MTILIISRESVARAEITVIFYVKEKEYFRQVLRTRAYYRDFLALTDVSSTMYRWMWRRDLQADVTSRYRQKRHCENCEMRINRKWIARKLLSSLLLLLDNFLLVSVSILSTKRVREKSVVLSEWIRLFSLE